MAGSPRKRAKRLGISLDPLDEPGFGQLVRSARKPLASIPWNKVALDEAQRELVALALKASFPRADVANALGITVKTLKRLIDDDPILTDAVDVQKDLEEAELRDCLMRNVRGGDTVAALFLLKSRHGYRDRDDAKLKVENQGGGVLVVPGTMPFEQWSAAAAIQQAPYRERPVEEPKVHELRVRTEMGDGMSMQRLLPGDLPN